MILGITGTRKHLTKNQIKNLEKLFLAMRCLEIHHGDCVGADTEAHKIFTNSMPSGKIVIHPPEKSILRAFNKGQAILPAKPYLERNRDIVEACIILVALPNTNYEIGKSGTWYTVRYARSRDKEMIILFPDGRVRTENLVSGSKRVIATFGVDVLEFNPDD